MLAKCDLLMAIPSSGVSDAKQDAKDEGRILYELLYVCGGKGWGRTPVASCKRSFRDLNVSIRCDWSVFMSLRMWVRSCIAVHFHPIRIAFTSYLRSVIQVLACIRLRESSDHFCKPLWP